MKLQRKYKNKCLCIAKRGDKLMILFNNKEADLEHKKTYQENIKFKFEGVALLLKLDNNRKN